MDSLRRIECLAIVIPSLVSILGFIFTYTSMKKSFENESVNQKRSIQLSKVMDLPYDILELLDDLMFKLVRETNEKNKKREMEKILEKVNSIQAQIYAYGSLDSIKIISNLQKDTYGLDKGNKEIDKNILIPQYILLVSQLKYDTTGEIISPKYWFEMKIKDNDSYSEKYEETINNLVEELDLNTSFKD